MLDKITEIVAKFKGNDIEFALTFGGNGGTLPEQLETLFLEETKQLVRKEKEKIINDLEQHILVWNNNVLMGKLAALRVKIEEESREA